MYIYKHEFLIHLNCSYFCREVQKKVAKSSACGDCEDGPATKKSKTEEMETVVVKKVSHDSQYPPYHSFTIIKYKCQLYWISDKVIFKPVQANNNVEMGVIN